MQHEACRKEDLAQLPAELRNQPGMASLFRFACLATVPDATWSAAATKFLRGGILNRRMQLAIELRTRDGQTFVTLRFPAATPPAAGAAGADDDDGAAGEDVAVTLLHEGLARIERRRERCFVGKLREYALLEEDARRHHRGVWEYGDIDGDDAREFGYRPPAGHAASGKARQAASAAIPKANKASR